MYLVVVKYQYYPSVFEFKTKEEAIEKYNKLKNDDYFKEQDNNGINDEDVRLYITEVNDYHGGNTQNIDWS